MVIRWGPEFPEIRTGSPKTYLTLWVASTPRKRDNLTHNRMVVDCKH